MDVSLGGMARKLVAAGDEIERLRAELEASHNAGAIMAERVRDQDAEIERLREALTAIAGFGDVNLAGEWEHGLRDIIGSMTRRAKDEMRGHQQYGGKE